MYFFKGILCNVKGVMHINFIHLYVILEDVVWQLNSPLSIMERGKLWIEFLLMNAIRDDLISFSKWNTIPWKNAMSSHKPHHIIISGITLIDYLIIIPLSTVFKWSKL